MISIKEFKKKVNFSRKNHLIQFLIKPLVIIRYFFLTRLAFLIKKPILGKAKLFFSKDLVGYFPEPVFSYIYLYGFSEDALTMAVSKYLKQKMTFIDVGSHIGYYSQLASLLVGKTGRVYSFEPTPSTFKLLFSNIKDLDNVFAFPLAIWSKTQELEFLDYGPFFAGCNSYTEARMSEEYLKKIVPKKIRVMAVSLDDYCEIMKIEPDFIKVDAESAEYNVLIGMKRVINKFKPIISLEIGDKEINPENGSRACIKFLQKLGYMAYEVKNGKIGVHELKGDYHLVYDNLLFLPKR